MYILQATARDRYVAGMTSIASPNYEDHVDLLLGKINAGEIKSRIAARGYLESLLD